MTRLEVHPETLRTAAADIDDLVWRAEEDFRGLNEAVAKVADGAPGTRTAQETRQFGDRWKRQLRKGIDELEAFARNLRQAADNYRGSDQASAENLNRVADPAWIEKHTVGGGYISPNSEYATERHDNWL